MKTIFFAPFFSLAMLFAPIALLAQRTVLGRPTVYAAPIDSSKITSCAQLLDGDRTAPWMVVVDRAGVKAYDKPGGSVESAEKPQFLECLYVTQVQCESGAKWVHLVDATTDGLRIVEFKREIGWVERKYLLEWTQGLRHPYTQIHLKALLLNKVGDGEYWKRPDYTDVETYASPDGSTPLGPRKIYNFYFVLKKENGHYLLCHEVQFSIFNASSRIIGWVSQQRCDNWNTRIVLEPNFADTAFRERHANPGFQVKGYQNFGSAERHSVSGKAASDPIWASDPVLLDSQASKRHLVGNRFRGQVMRFPMLSSGGLSRYSKSYRSAVIGKVQLRNKQGKLEPEDPKLAALLVDEARKTQEQMRRANVIFVIEGTPSMDAEKQNVVRAMKKIKELFPAGDGKWYRAARFGTVIYRHPAEQTVDKMVEVLPLTKEKDEAIRFVENAEFNRWKSTSPYTCLRYGLLQAVQRGGFVEGETNIIILLGNNADFRQDRDQDTLYRGHRAYVTNAVLADNMAEYDIQLYGIQLQNRGDNASIGFAEQVRGFIARSATEGFNKGRGSDGNQATAKTREKLRQEQGLQVLAPSMAELGTNGSDLWLQNADFPSRLLVPQQGRSFSGQSLSEQTARCAEHSTAHAQKISKALDDLVVGVEALDEVLEDDPSSGPFMAEFLLNRLPSSGLSPEQIAKICREKHNLHTEAYFPRDVAGAKAPMFSYVLFMPEEDMKTYKAAIDKLIGNQDNLATFDKQRKTLQACYFELLKQFTGREFSDQEFDSTKVSDIVAYMQGVHDEGLRLSVPDDVNMSCLLDKECFPDANLEKRIKRFTEVSKHLDGILRRGNDKALVFKTSDTDNHTGLYYWIPIEEVF